ncbi:MAG: xylulokinase [Bacillota bacterium]
MKTCFIGFDNGTMGTKVGLYDLDGNCLAVAFNEVHCTYPNPGWVEMDANEHFENVVKGIAEVIQKTGIDPANIKGISGSGIVDGTVPIDDDFNAIGPFIPYLDMRSQAEAKEVRENCEPIWVEESAKWGLGPDCVPMVMKWLYKHADYAKRAKKFCNIEPFVMGKLGGMKSKDAFIDWSHASGWLIGFDLEKNDWSKRQFDMYGLPFDVLPRVVAPWEVVGYVCPEMAGRTGLKAGTPLVAGGGDLMVATLGAGVVDAGQAMDVAGTASIMTFITDDLDAARKNEVLVTSKSIYADKLCLWGCLSSGGFARGWYRDGILNLKGITEAYPMMDALAEKVPAGAMASIFAPYLTGTMTPSWPYAKGAWLGLTPGHNQAHLWRTLMESVAFEYRMFLKSLEDQGVTYSNIMGVGGGAKSAVWNQIKADTLNVPYTLITTQDSGALGTCVIAGHATGYFSDMAATVQSWTEKTRTFTPRPEYVDFYNKFYELRQEVILGPLSQIFDMWEKIEALEPPK